MARSKLDVINGMLASTGTDPLTANDTNHPSYIKALAKFDEVNDAWQGMGWWFNTTSPIIAPTTGDEIVFASDVLHIDPLLTDKNYVKRGNRLYDMDNETFTITESVECHVVRLKDYTDLPPPAQAYLLAHARYEYFLDEDGSRPKLDKYEEAMGRAWAFFQREHLKNADVNIFKGGHGLWFRSSYHAAGINRSVARQAT